MRTPRDLPMASLGTWTPASRVRRSGTSVPVTSLLSDRQPTFHENGLEHYRDWHTIFPYSCNDLAAERLDILHSLIYEVALRRRMFVSPLPPQRPGEPLRLLDIGCGTARWAQEVADTHPQVEVYGLDIGDIHVGLQSEASPNFWFRSGVDFESSSWDADYESGSFNYIRMSLLQGAVSDWPRLLQRAHRLLAPGGHLDVIDIDWFPHVSSGTFPTHSHYRDLWIALASATERHNKPILFDRQAMDQNLRTCGFEASHYHHETLYPCGRCAGGTDHELTKKLAGWTRLLLGTADLKFLWDSAVAVLTYWDNWQAQQAAELAEKARKEILDPNCPFHFYLHMWSVRKMTPLHS